MSGAGGFQKAYIQYFQHNRTKRSVKERKKLGNNVYTEAHWRQSPQMITMLKHKQISFHPNIHMANCTPHTPRSLTACLPLQHTFVACLLTQQYTNWYNKPSRNIDVPELRWHDRKQIPRRTELNVMGLWTISWPVSPADGIPAISAEGEVTHTFAWNC